MFILECLGAGVRQTVSFTEWWTRPNTSIAPSQRQRYRLSTTRVARVSASRALSHLLAWSAGGRLMETPSIFRTETTAHFKTGRHLLLAQLDKHSLSMES